MHSLTSRANALFAFTLTTLASVTLAAYLTTALDAYAAKATLGAQRVQVKQMADYGSGAGRGSRHDLASMGVDVEVDLSPLFNWNVKQLFLILTANYATEVNVVNQVVLWDKIILRQDQTTSAALSLRDANTEYYFWDDGNGLKSISLSYQPCLAKTQLPFGLGLGYPLINFQENYFTHLSIYDTFYFYPKV